MEQESGEKINPNNIGELVSFSREVETFSNRVYRSASDKAAIDDLVSSGVVRNKQSAGIVEKSRGDGAVYWSKGEEGKYHNVQPGGYVMEAPYNIASERQITIDDLTALYHKTQDGEIRDILEEILSSSLR